VGTTEKAADLPGRESSRTRKLGHARAGIARCLLALLDGRPQEGKVDTIIGEEMSTDPVVEYPAQIRATASLGELGEQVEGRRIDCNRQLEKGVVEDQATSVAVGQGELEHSVEATVHRGVEKAGMVGRGDENPVREAPLKLDKEGGDEALQLADLVGVITTLGESIELVKEEEARRAPRRLESASEVPGALAEQTSDDRRGLGPD
jgi:hypothetical protein